MGRINRKSQAGIQSPRLPKIVELSAIPHDELTEATTYSQFEFQQVTLTGQKAYRVHFEEGTCTQLTVNETEFDEMRVDDVRWSGCNLANATWVKLACLRVSFTGCRMTGFLTREAVLQDTTFADCQCELSQFFEAKLKSVRFDRCSLVGADFRNADVSGVVFAQCDLTDTDFTGATMMKADLRGCPIAGMRVNPKDLQGAIVDEGQALALVRAMGITIV